MRHLLPLLACLGLATSSPGQEQPSSPRFDLRYRFEALDGMTARYSTRSEQASELSALGRGLEVGSELQLSIERSFRAIEGGGVVRSRVRKLDAVVDVGGDKREYHSDTGAGDDELRERLGFLLEASVSLELGSNGSVSDLASENWPEGQTELLDSFRDAWIAFPEDSLAIGGRWESTIDRSLPQGGSLITLVEYELRDVRLDEEGRQLAIIEAKLEIGTSADCPMRVVSSEGRISVHFDLQRGLIVQRQSEIALELESDGALRRSSLKLNEKLLSLDAP